MASKLPYLASPGVVGKTLNKILEARRPDRFTQDFLGTKLGLSGGSSMAIIPLLKKLGFLSSDGTPTARYDQFRNTATQGFAMSAGLRDAYSELYDRNEYAHDLTKDKLAGLVIEVTGASKDDSTTKLTVSTFWALKDFASFDAEVRAMPSSVDDPQATQSSEDNGRPKRASVPSRSNDTEVGFNVSYTINLNLPETTNPEVFNAIFRALKENLLRNQ